MKTAIIITAVRSGDELIFDVREMAILAQCPRGCCVTVATEDGVTGISDNDMTEDRFVRVITSTLTVQWLREQEELGFMIESVIAVDKYLGSIYDDINVLEWSHLTDGESYA